MILDTNALSALAEGNLRVREVVRDAAGPFLPVIVLGEVPFWNTRIQRPSEASPVAF